MDNVKIRNFILHKFTEFIHNSKTIFHMRQATKSFDFIFPLNHKVVRNLKIVNEHIGDLHVEGSVSLNSSVSLLSQLDERYTVDIDFVKWNGTDIKPVLELTGLLDDVQEAALRHCVSLFESPLKKAA